MTTAYIDMAFKITKSIDKKRFCETSEAKRAKIEFYL